MFIYVVKRITLASVWKSDCKEERARQLGGYCSLQGREDGGSLSGESRFK